MAIDDNTSYELTGAQIKDFATKIKSKADSSSLSPVATSGDYNDLDNLPTLPTVNNGALTIKQNGTTIGTFSANQSTNTTINIDAFYPVGSIYMTATLSTAADVEAALGGTWVAWGAGRVPVGVDTSQTEFDTVEETGGEKTHTLTIEEMPSHSHSIYTVDSGSGNQGKRDGLYYQGGWWGNGIGAPNVGNTGGSKAHNNLQPYITCYMYKRTA